MKHRVDIPLESLVDEVASLREIPWERLRVTGIDGGPAPEWISRNLRILSQVASVNDHRFTWGRFSELERVGAGASGEVFRTLDPDSGQRIALKLFHPAQHNPARVAPDRLDEARRLQRVESRAVARVYGAGAHDDRVGLWMEWVDGRSCDQVVSAEGPFSTEDALRILTAVCGAVTQLHRVGLVFREIRPSNVMLAPDGRVVFLDAGGCETFNSHHLEKLAPLHRYTAPEVMLGAAPTARSDVFALAGLFNFLRTANHPYAADEVADLVVGYRERRRPSPCLELPAAVGEVLQRALSPEPGDRPPDPALLAEQLSTASVSETAGAPRRDETTGWVRWIWRRWFD